MNVDIANVPANRKTAMDNDPTERQIHDLLDTAYRLQDQLRNLQGRPSRLGSASYSAYDTAVTNLKTTAATFVGYILTIDALPSA